MRIYKLFFNTPILIFGLLFFTLTSCYDNQGDEEKMSILKQKPVFKTRLSAYGTRYKVSINDISIYTEMSSSSQVDTEFSINHYMHPEKNILSVELIPSHAGGKINENARVNLELWVSSAEPGVENEYKVADITFASGDGYLDKSQENSSISGSFSAISGFEVSENGDVFIGEVFEESLDIFDGAFSLRREIRAKNALPLWSFFKGEVLPRYELLSDEEYEAVLSEAYPEIEVIQNALLEGTEEAVDRIMPLFEERSRETDKAFYLPDGETQAGLREEFLYAITSKTQSLVDLKQEYLALIVENNNLLLSLKRNGSRNAIVFNDSSYDGSNSFPIMFRRENGKWIITR